MRNVSWAQLLETFLYSHLHQCAFTEGIHIHTMTDIHTISESMASHEGLVVRAINSRCYP